MLDRAQPKQKCFDHARPTNCARPKHKKFSTVLDQKNLLNRSRPKQDVFLLSQPQIMCLNEVLKLTFFDFVCMKVSLYASVLSIAI